MVTAELFKYKLLKKWRPINKYEKVNLTLKIIKNEKNQGLYVKDNKDNFYNLRCTLNSVNDYFVIKTVFEKIKNIRLNYIEICKILKRIKKNEISNQKKKYSNIILGTAQFGGKYGVANKEKLKKKDLNNIFRFANEIGVNKIDNALNYKGVHNNFKK